MSPAIMRKNLQSLRYRFLPSTGCPFSCSLLFTSRLQISGLTHPAGKEDGRMDELLVPNDAPQPLWPVISQLRRSKTRSKSESFDVAERQMSPEMDGSKTAAVDSLQVDKPSNAQTVKLPPKSLIEKWGLRELVAQTRRSRKFFPRGNQTK
jgi:hypothetical protein